MSLSVSGQNVFKHYTDIPLSRRELDDIFPMRPMRSEAEYDEAVAIASSMAGHDLNPEQDDYLSVLGTLIIAYEDEHSPFELPSMSVLDALRGLLRDHNMTAADLSRLLGLHRSLGAKILRGERSITLRHSRVLAERFKVRPEFFLAGGDRFNTSPQ